MGANCGKEEPSADGFTSSTAVEKSVSRNLKLSRLDKGEAPIEKKKSSVKGGGMGGGVVPDLTQDPPEKATKALKGKALLAACMLTDEDEEEDDFVDFNDDKKQPNIPGIVSDSPTATERKRRADKARRATPTGTGTFGTGSRRRSKRFQVDKDDGKQTKALRGKALMQACMDGSYSSDDDM
jgi:hypothetical protein